ncbi:hypothetical protein Agub_g2394 [Astrephomene gubernaculifera]|uniref:Methyltransferase type 11 domain-containing protein n=1 Tax=Astrephomene gubernaculifera TaxID=47775 RepID=A0AAD3HIS8_9CHLO|nr:hypothetical protein Agub_g2394 [Astrephomene gubernaculifera]
MKLSVKPFQQTKGIAHRKRCMHVVCKAQQTASRPPHPLIMDAVEALFRFPPFFNAAAKNARNMIIKRAYAMGIDWNGTIQEMKAQDWEARLQAVQNPSVTYPSYYTQPFHAYSQGNLCWDAALELTLAAQSVHAIVMDPRGKELDPQGDAKLRSGYSARLKECLAELGVAEEGIRSILDLGCATGLSSRELMRVFPGAAVTGLDLSPHFIAVGRYEADQRAAANGGMAEPLTLLHGLAESTGLPSDSQDLVSLCLVCHELPHNPTRDIMREAFRVLRPGGVLAVMDMNPASPIFQRIFNNPIVFTAFKSTEPWLADYISLDMPATMQEVGFSRVLMRESTPRHRTLVALKK